MQLSRASFRWGDEESDDEAQPVVVPAALGSSTAASELSGNTLSTILLRNRNDSHAFGM